MIHEGRIIATAKDQTDEAGFMRMGFKLDSLEGWINVTDQTLAAKVRRVAKDGTVVQVDFERGEKGGRNLKDIAVLGDAPLGVPGETSAGVTSGSEGGAQAPADEAIPAPGAPVSGAADISLMERAVVLLAASQLCIVERNTKELRSWVGCLEHYVAYGRWPS